MYTKEKNSAEPFVNTQKELHSLGRQFIKQTFNHVGYVDIIRPEQSIEKNSMTGKKIFFFELDSDEYSIDIDEKKDFLNTISFFENKISY